MKKIRKRLMMIVAVLLSMVLLTSSVVSTTLAKYVITKSATSTVKLTKYNATITMTKGTSENVPALTETKKKGDSIEYTMTGITLKPGDNYSNLITASISVVKPPVDSKVTITVDVKNVKINESIDTEPFKVPKADFSTLTLSADKAYLPLAVYVNNTSKLDAYTSYDYTATVIEETIENTIGNAFVAITPSNVTDTAYVRENGMAKVTGAIAKSTSKTATWSGLSFGFEWPKNVGGSMDEVGTWIAKARPSFDIVYKITVEQKT